MLNSQNNYVLFVIALYTACFNIPIILDVHFRAYQRLYFTRVTSSSPEKKREADIPVNFVKHELLKVTKDMETVSSETTVSFQSSSTEQISEQTKQGEEGRATDAVDFTPTAATTQQNWDLPTLSRLENSLTKYMEGDSLELLKEN